VKKGCKCLGRIWGVPSLFRNFLRNFLYMEMGFHSSVYTFSGMRSNFSLGSVTDARASAGRVSHWYCAVRWVFHCAVDHSFSL
jgi:hypothetical protein